MLAPCFSCCRPSLIPYFPAKEIAPPLQASLFDAYDASVFNPATQPIGLIGQEPWRVTTPHPAATPVTPTASSKVPEFPTPAVGATSAATVSFASPLPTSSAPLKSSPSQLHLPSPAAGSGAEATKKKTLGAKKKSSSGDVAGATDAAATPATPQSTTSGPNVALQQHVQNQGVKAPTTAFQTRWGHLFGHLYATLDRQARGNKGLPRAQMVLLSSLTDSIACDSLRAFFPLFQRSTIPSARTGRVCVSRVCCPSRRSTGPPCPNSE